MWHVGQKIVCINDKNVSSNALKKDNIYTIELIREGLNKDFTRGIGFLLQGVCVFSDIGTQIGYAPKRFVPLDILNNDSLIEQLLKDRLITK